MTTSPADHPVAFDVAVVGAGPAGAAAAVTAADSGARVVVLDSGARPGGQFYRRPPLELVRRPGDAPHHPWPAFDDLERRLLVHAGTGRVQLFQDTTVWAAERRGGQVRLRTRGTDRDLGPTGTVVAGTVVLATGAYDRQLPVPGWELPGVVGGGAAQALVKGSRSRPGDRVLVAGTGPFLLAVAATLLDAGVGVVAVVEANAPEALLRRAPALVGGTGKAGELAHYLALLVRHRVPYLRRRRLVRVHGQDRVVGATVAKVDARWRALPRTERRLDCDTVAVGYGFTAQAELPLQLGCAASLGADGGLAIDVDAHQATSVPGVFTAGETTGVGGAELALAEGLLAGAAAATACGRTPSLTDAEAARLQRVVARTRRFAAALHGAFDVRDGWWDDLDDDTLVCRCEEVSVGQVRDAVHGLGATDPRTVKLLSRAGMGWCQGRICGYAVDRVCNHLVADLDDTDQARAARLTAASRRPLSIPVRLGDVAASAAEPDPG